MGRKLDVLLGRKFKTSKFKATLNLAVSRITVLKNQRQARLAVARSDIVQLLNLYHHEHALLRVDQVIKEQNMIDALVMVDGYCHLLLQMVNLIEKEKGFPDELKEPIASLLYAAPRCGELPELQEVREILTSRYGKEFAYAAIELRGDCGVNTKMIQKLSPRQSSLETRMKMLQVIADENGVFLKLEDSSPSLNQFQREEESSQSEIASDFGILNDKIDEVLSFSESRKEKKKYRDVEDAAQAAFESAAYAAAAARAAVELSRSRSSGSENPDSPNSRPRKVHYSNPEKSKLQMKNEKTESESEEEGETTFKNNTMAGDSDGYYMALEKKMVFDEIEDEDVDSGNSVGEGLKPVQQLDLTKKLISVRTRRVYGPP